MLGTTDAVTVQGWYSDEASQPEEIRTSDEVIYTSDIDALVSAMASFAVLSCVDEMSSRSQVTGSEPTLAVVVEDLQRAVG